MLRRWWRYWVFDIDTAFVAVSCVLLAALIVLVLITSAH